MLALGSLLALLSGVLNAAAAALEKHQGMRAAGDRRGLALLAVLARRPLWALAIGLSAVAWVCEAASLATAPVPVVATLRNAGRGLLVAGGHRWLEERFTAAELAGVVITGVGGTITAIGATGSNVVRRPMSNLAELEVGAACVVAAAVVARLAGRSAAPTAANAVAQRKAQHRTKAAGVAMGTAVGILFAGTGVFTKEIGDRFALYGLGGWPAVLGSLSPWLMIAMSVWAQSLIQQAFRRANAASVSAANASVASLGLIAAGFLLYGETIPGGLDEWLLLGGMVLAIAGTVVLIGARPHDEPRAPAAAPVPEPSAVEPGAGPFTSV